MKKRKTLCDRCDDCEIFYWNSDLHSHVQCTCMQSDYTVAKTLLLIHDEEELDKVLDSLPAKLFRDMKKRIDKGWKGCTMLAEYFVEEFNK